MTKPANIERRQRIDELVVLIKHLASQISETDGYPIRLAAIATELGELQALEYWERHERLQALYSDSAA